MQKTPFIIRDFTVMPWKNGGGVTTELFRLPKSHGSAEFNLRLSMAQIDSNGPFSFYPSLDRHLLIVEGKGIKLKFKEQIITLTKESAPFSFAGEEEVTSELMDGPVVDFNVMIDRAWGKANIQLIDGPSVRPQWFKCETQFCFIYQHSPDRFLQVLRLGDRVKIETNVLLINVNEIGVMP